MAAMSKQRYSTNAERQRAYRARKAGTVTPTVTQFQNDAFRKGLSWALSQRLATLATTYGLDAAQEAAAIALQAVADDQQWHFIRQYAGNKHR